MDDLNKLLEKEKKLKEKIAALRRREAEKAKREREAQIARLGKLAYDAGLGSFDDSALKSGFAEIARKKHPAAQTTTPPAKQEMPTT